MTDDRTHRVDRTILRLPEGTFSYHPSERLGQKGGFGEVFAGSDGQGNPVAIKVLDLNAAEAAHRELKVAAELKKRSNEYIIPVFASGEDAETGAYVLVMARAERSLHEYRTALTSIEPLEVIDILSDIVRGLTEAKDWVHRDIKPQNVLRHQGRWKVADFGIARFVEEATSANTLKDSLTPQYAAPEQWRGERATHATDSYALGCVAFFLVTGHPPFSRNFAEEHQLAAAPQLSSGNPRLDSLVGLLLRKPPESRPSHGRVETLLKEARQSTGAANRSADQLAKVGALLVREQQEKEAAAAAEARERRRRQDLAAVGRQVLRENLRILWEKIESLAPTAVRTPVEGATEGMRVQVGGASIYIETSVDVLPLRAQWPLGWDVLLGGRLEVRQLGSRPYKWSTSLWYGTRLGSDLRWFEVGFFAPFQATEAPLALSFPDAAAALGPAIGTFSVACGPWEIDDEAQDSFHDRMLWLIGKAAAGELRHPSYLPIRDWASFAR